LTTITGILVLDILTIKYFGKQPRSGRLSNTSGTGKNVRMGNPAPAYGILKRPGNVLLSYQILKDLRTPFSG
jgi:hypothetical protein